MHTCSQCGQPIEGSGGGQDSTTQLAELLAAKLGGGAPDAGGDDLNARAEDDVLRDLIEKTGEWGVGGLKKPGSPEDEEDAPR